MSSTGALNVILDGSQNYRSTVLQEVNCGNAEDSDFDG